MNLVWLLSKPLFAAVNLFTLAHARAAAETYWSDVTQWLRLSNGAKPYCGLRDTSIMDSASVLYRLAAACFKRSWRVQARGTASAH